MSVSVESQAATRRTDWVALACEVGPAFAARAADHDERDTFVVDNYAELKARRFFSAGVPVELGGGGASHSELCVMLRELARHCGSTSLALSMHTHLLAMTVWRWRQEQPVEPLLRRVAQEQIVLVSTGASDWLDSSGTADPVEGGYRITGRKIFGSGSPAGTLLVTSAVYDDPVDGPTVLHFPAPLATEGVTVLDNWRTLGMRATGSHDVLLENVFVPEGAVSLCRPKGQWHTFFNAVATIALPLVMSVYAVEKAFEVAGGGAFFRSIGLERLLRDVHGSQFHPLQEKRQHLFTGRVALGLDPVG